MTRKDFELIAATLYAAAPIQQGSTSLAYQVACGQHRRTCEEFAIRLSVLNPRFDRARFLAACGVDP